MLIKIAAILWSIEIITRESRCLNLVELTESSIKPVNVPLQPRIAYEHFPLKKQKLRPMRRYWPLLDESNMDNEQIKPRAYEDEKDVNLKDKISTLVQQTMHDTEKAIKNVEKIKEAHGDKTTYRAGFILSRVKKSKDVLDELFNVAVKNRVKWLALEQLKIFEIIVQANVDTTNLVRQLVDLHVKQLNVTQSDKKEIILI